MPVLLLLLLGWLTCLSPVRAENPAPPPPTDPLAALDTAQVQEVFQWLSKHALDPAVLSQDALNRAALRSLLKDSRTGAVILPVPTEESHPVGQPPLHARLGAAAAYARTGALTPENVDALADFLRQLPAEVTTLFLDLRGPLAPGPLAGAAALAGLFLPEKTPVFLTNAPPAAPVAHATARPPVWSRRVWLLVDERTPPPAELAAHLLDRHLDTLTFGAPTSGSLAETTDRPLGPQFILRLPASTVSWPDGTRLTGTPIIPELAVESNPAAREALLTLTDPAALAPRLVETDRPRLNEAAIMAGIPAEILSLTTPPVSAVPPDPVLQQAMDLLQTSTLLNLDAPEEIKRAQPNR